MGQVPPDDQRCRGIKKDGKQCKGYAKEDGLCVFHLRQEKPAVVYEAMPEPTEVARPVAELIPIPFRRSVPSLRRPVRMVKMVQPKCGECRDLGFGWWENCPHDPYRSYFTVPGAESPQIEEVNGRKMVRGTIKADDELELRENIVQVPAEDKIYSGRGPDASRQRGYKEVMEFGFQPVCEYRDCYEPAKIHCQYGNYCSRDQAAMMGLVMESKPVFIDEGEDGKRFREQLNAVNLVVA